MDASGYVCFVKYYQIVSKVHRKSKELLDLALDIRIDVL